MDSNNNENTQIEEQDLCLFSDSSTTSIKSESSSSSSPYTKKLSVSSEDCLNEDSSSIIEVWENNIEKELKNIGSILEKNEEIFVGMDTEFPGIISNLKRITNDFYYKNMKLNVELTQLIQLGITLTDKNGEKPKGISCNTWQFNFQFDIEKDKYSEESINLLKNSGINFDNLKKNGIKLENFFTRFIRSGLVLNPKVKWVSYQGSYDFAYLLKILRNENFPENEKKFIETLKIYFPEFYDVKMLIKDNETYFHGGLSRLIYKLGIERKGINHQAGSDSIATIEAFHKLIKNEFIEKEQLKRGKNVLYGIDTGKDNQNTIKYLNNSNNNLNMNNVNNVNVNKYIEINDANNTVLNRNLQYLQRQNQMQQMNNYINNFSKVCYPIYFLNTNTIMKNQILMNQMRMRQNMMGLI